MPCRVRRPLTSHSGDRYFDERGGVPAGYEHTHFGRRRDRRVHIVHNGSRQPARAPVLLDPWGVRMPVTADEAATAQAKAPWLRPGARPTTGRPE
ncbi:hypothetical protein BIV23_20815 [Streptomyces monashensis]|uniref:Uncharacterized protein n=1 Tax=Streptomyces monashensis TaxID=1678012 RepID=A0A1S2QDE8_9ACTN|nr:hypothetical protein BIV23_20815 [Streptomyces monashensis]